MGDAHAQFPLRTKLTSHWMSLLLQTNTLKNLFQTSKKCEFSVLKMLKMCFPRTQICSPLLLCSPAHLCMPGDRVPGIWHREDTVLGDLCALPGSSSPPLICGDDITAVSVATERGTAIPERDGAAGRCSPAVSCLTVCPWAGEQSWQVTGFLASN